MIIHDPFPTGRRDPGPMRGAEVSALHQRPRRSINTAPGSASGGLAALFFVLLESSKVQARFYLHRFSGARKANKCKVAYIYCAFCNSGS